MAFQYVRTIVAMIARSKSVALLLFILLTLAAMPVRASLFSIAASGTISLNDSGDATIPVGTTWSFQIIYDTAAPDLDFEVGGSADPTFGRFTNTGTPPAMRFFHYKAGSYQVTLNDAADFGTFSNMIVTFTSVKGLDINLTAPALFPHLAGGDGGVPCRLRQVWGRDIYERRVAHEYRAWRGEFRRQQCDACCRRLAW